MISASHTDKVTARRPVSPLWPASVTARITGQEWFLAFLLGLGSQLNVRFIGYFKLSEIACFVLLPILLPAITRNRIFSRLGPIMPLLGLWLVGTVLSDLWNQSDFGLCLRGIARVVTIAVCVPVMTLFLQKGLFGKSVAMTWGSIPGIYISAYYFRSGAVEGRELVTGDANIKWETHWTGLAMAAFGVVSLLLYRRSHLLAYGTTIAGSAIQLVNGSRSAAGPGVVASILSFAIDLFGHPVSKQERRRSFLRAVAIAGACGLAIGVTFITYARLAESGALGEAARAKYQKQSSAEYGVIGGGRLDFFCGLLAVSESPIIGHGSWATDKNEYYRRTTEWLNYEYNPDFYRKGYPLIPAHSALLGSWVETGILGSFFWFYLLYLCIRVIFTKTLDDRQMRLAILTSAIGGIFNILFSPMYSRIGYAVFVATFINIMPLHQRVWTVVSERRQGRRRPRGNRPLEYPSQPLGAPT